MNAPGVLRAQHLLTTGDVDPLWPTHGALVCGASATRDHIGLVPDGIGGSYAWWLEGAGLYVSRIGGDGGVASGWPERGRAVGVLAAHDIEPDVIADGAHGIHLAWVEYDSRLADPYQVHLQHISASDPIGSWSRTLGGATSEQTLDCWPRLALAEDGGGYVAWASWSSTPDAVPSTFRLQRFTLTGATATGWPGGGVVARGSDLPGDLLYETAARQVAVASASGTGVYLLIGDPTGYLEGAADGPDVRLMKYQADGAVDPAWPSGGVVLDWAASASGFAHSLQLFTDPRGGAIAGAPLFMMDAPWAMSLRWFGPTGTRDPDRLIGARTPGQEFVPDGQGGLFAGEFYPRGPFSPWGSGAYIAMAHCGDVARGLFIEVPPDSPDRWYGDIAIAPTGDGGAVFFWSQEHEQFGLFARRFTSAGEVTGVEPGVAPIALALRGLRWSAGRGVSARVSLAGGPAALELYDLAGRRLARERLGDDARGEREVTLAGTARLGAGLYFARLTGRDGVRLGRVIVTP